MLLSDWLKKMLVCVFIILLDIPSIEILSGIKIQLHCDQCYKSDNIAFSCCNMAGNLLHGCFEKFVLQTKLLHFELHGVGWTGYKRPKMIT